MALEYRASMNERMTLESALAAVAESAEERYGVLLQHGTLEIGMYSPKGVDPQSPHDQDEVYIVASGNGRFVVADTEQPFEAGEALFVPAGDVHRFVDFSDDFSAWVIFYGPHGGETAE